MLVLKGNFNKNQYKNDIYKEIVFLNAMKSFTCMPTVSTKLI